MPRLRILGVEDGLPSSTINGVTRDRAGYVWLATTDGLARYDGVQVRTWRHVPGDPEALPGNYITAVHVDGRDRVWAAVEGRGLSMLGADRAGFRHFSKSNLPRMGSDNVWALASDEDGLWFGTFGGGLHRLSGIDEGPGTIERHVHDAGDARSLPSDTVLSLRFDRSGRLWVGTSQGLARRTGRGFERLPLPGSEPAPMIFSVVPEGDALWVGAGSGAFRREADGDWHVPSWSPMFEYPNAIFDIAAGDDGRHWIASHRHLWRIARDGVPEPVPVGANGPVRAIFQMLRQDDGALWVPVPGAGLGYLRPGWRRIAQYSRTQGGLSSELYRAVMPANEGGAWLVGGRGEVERLDRDGELRPLKTTLQDGLEGRRPISGVQDRDGRLWLGERQSLLRVDPDGGIREWRTDDETDAPLDGAIALLQLAPDGTLWLSCSGAGLQQRDPDSGRVLHTIEPGAGQGLGIGDVEALAFDDRARLWVADARGLSRWDEVDGRLRPVPGIAAGERVFAFAFDGADRLWLQRLTGLERYARDGDGDGWQLRERIGIEAGIPAVEGAALRVDRQHRVWLSTSRGLYRWDPEQRHARRFGVHDGLSSQEFQERAMTLTGDGLLVAAVADGGIVLVDTLAADPPPATPVLRWDRVDVRRGGRWQPLDGADGERMLSLAPDDRELRVQLRLLAFDAPASNRYFTRLDGYDREWVAHGASGERVLAGLPAGPYTLRARGVDAVGNAAQEQILRFIVQPPWWQTSWALAGALALLALLGWSAADVYRDRLRRRQAQQRAEHERAVAEQASLAKTRFLATLGHEVRTPMTGVLGMSELLLATELDPKQYGYTRSIRQAGEHLLRLVNDALDLARIESGKLELADEPFDLRALVDEATALMAPLARQRGLQFDVDVAGDLPPAVRGDGPRVCQILLNLLGNAIKFTERGSVSLRVESDAGAWIRFNIADTGPGLNDEQRSRLFRRFEQADGARTAARYGGSGLGLAICQELAAAMGGQIQVDSSPGAGTRFTVSLPLQPAAPATPPRAAATAPQPARALALLLVEDDATVAEVIAGLLRRQGHVVTHVGNGLAALTEVAVGRFDAALLDLDLPGMDGFALARQLREQGFDRPLLAITARADADAEPEAVAAGFQAFLRKPVTGAMLARLLEEVAPATAGEGSRTPALSP